MTSTDMASAEVGHTPGPWHFDGDWHRLPTIYGAEGGIVAFIEKTGVNRGDHTAEQTADAHLIAAAPDMLRGELVLHRKAMARQFSRQASPHHTQGATPMTDNDALAQLKACPHYCPGEWSDDTPSSPREYSGAVWSCFDDQFQIEIEELSHDPAEWHHGQATHWRALSSRPALKEQPPC